MRDLNVTEKEPSTYHGLDAEYYVGSSCIFTVSAAWVSKELHKLVLCITMFVNRWCFSSQRMSNIVNIRNYWKNEHRCRYSHLLLDIGIITEMAMMNTMLTVVNTVVRIMVVVVVVILAVSDWKWTCVRYAITSLVHVWCKHRLFYCNVSVYLIDRLRT